MSTREFWDNEARTDERYIAGRWGLRADGSDDVLTTTRIIANIVSVADLLDRVGPAERRLIAEVGCGPGRILSPLATLYGVGRNFIGVDISPEMVKLAQARVALPNVKFVYTNGLALPACQPDMVYSVELFQHLTLPEKGEYLIEMFRWLKPGGLALIQFVWRADEGPMSHPINPAWMRAAAQNAGFIDHDPGFMWRLTPEWDWCLLEKPI